MKEVFEMNKIAALLLVIGVNSLNLESTSILEYKEATIIASKMINRDDGKSSYSKNLLLTCDYKIQNSTRKCISGKRKKIFEGISLDLDEKGDITKGLSIIIEPASEKGMAFLQKDYNDEKIDSEQWIYMPALKRLKRIVATESSGPKTGTLFGSEIAYEDIEKKHLSHYRYRLIKEEKIGDKEAWVLEVIPTRKRSPKSSYSKEIVWVDKESYIPLKGDSYNKQGILSKTFISREIKKINGIFYPFQQIIVNHLTRRMSLLKSLDIKINIEVDDELVSTRMLNDQNYRENKLKKFRKDK